MPRYTLPLVAAKEMARYLVPHVCRSSVTPALMGVVVGGERFGQHAFATDRYSLGRYDLTNLLTSGAEKEVWVPREALTILYTVGRHTLLYGHSLDNYHVSFDTTKISASMARTVVEITYRDGDLRELHWMRVFQANGATGNFPPTERLFESFIPGERTRFGSTAFNLAKFLVAGQRADSLRLTHSKPENHNKTGLTLIENGDRFKGLLAENLLLGDNGFGTDLAMDNLKAHEAKQAEVKPDAGVE